MSLGPRRFPSGKSQLICWPRRAGFTRTWDTRRGLRHSSALEGWPPGLSGRPTAASAEGLLVRVLARGDDRLGLADVEEPHGLLLDVQVALIVQAGERRAHLLDYPVLVDPDVQPSQRG